MVGTLPPSAATRSAPLLASGRSRPSRDHVSGRHMAVEAAMELAAQVILQHRPLAAIGDMRHVQLRFLGEGRGEGVDVLPAP